MSYSNLLAYCFIFVKQWTTLSNYILQLILNYEAGTDCHIFMTVMSQGLTKPLKLRNFRISFEAFAFYGLW